MNGFKQISAFYSFVFSNSHKVNATHVSLYVFLWNQNNRNNWVEWFKCPYDLAMQGACIGNKNTYYKCLNDLKEWKLIEYNQGINGFKAPTIKLIQLYESDTAIDTATVPLSEPLLIPQLLPLPIHIIKLITNNLQLIIDNLERWILSEKTNKKQPNKKQNILFSESDIYLLENLIKVAENFETPYKDADLKYYHETVKNWAESKNEKKINWLSTLKGFILRDFKDGKMKTVKPENKYKTFIPESENKW